MGLQSELFRGDSKLENAAVSDPAHITKGARGDHVRKIQQALIQLDGAAIEADGDYGPATAAAVLAYKQKRNIVNRSYQSKADDIVGKMTMASLDSEMVKLESRPVDPVQIEPISRHILSPPRSPALVALLESSQPVGGPRVLPRPPGSKVMEVRKNGTGTFVVQNGSPGEVTIADPAIAKIRDLSRADSTPRDKVLVASSSQLFEVIGAQTLGRTTITARRSFGSEASIDVVVKTFLEPVAFVPGTNHAHKPSGRWKDVQENPNNAPPRPNDDDGAILFIILERVTRNKEHDTPEKFVDEMMNGPFSGKLWGGKPIAKKHANWYLTDGNGADFDEDENVENWLKSDVGIRRRLRREIFPRGKRPQGKGHFTFPQPAFRDLDFRFAFGGIDRVDFQVDFSKDAVRVWFQDRYNWHPFYPFYDVIGPTREFPDSGDFRRPNNSVHAAMVEMKDKGAKDFWMKGQGEVALSLIAAAR
jgi:hypothetical protein